MTSRYREQVGAAPPGISSLLLAAAAGSWVISAYLSPQVGNFQVSLPAKFLTVPRLRLVQHHPCSVID